MVRKVCLDSDVIIALLEKGGEAKNFLKSLNAYFYTTSINIFEVWYGKKKREPVQELFGLIEILGLSESESVRAANIMSGLKKKGELLEHRDVFIAAICIENNVEFFSYNKKHFERLEKFGLKLVSV